MRRVVVTACLVTLVSAVLPARTADYRREFGIVLLPAPAPEGQTLAAAAVCTPNDPAEAIIGAMFELTATEADGEHMFLLLDAQMGMTPPPTDFDITFFSDLGSCDPADARLPSPAQPPMFAGRGNESGVVPAGMRHAIVTTKDGVLVAFELRIFS